MEAGSRPGCDPGPFDVLVLGSGVAGLSVSLALAPRRAASETGAAQVGTSRPAIPRVGILTKGSLADATTRWAQGGVAAVLGTGDANLGGRGQGSRRDSVGLHLADTVAAGAGLCDTDAAGLMVSQGPERVEELISLGTVFDRWANGELALAQEGGHSSARVVHAGGAATGAEVERALVEAVRATPTTLLEGWFGLDLLVEEGRCRGVVAIDPAGQRAQLRATHVVLATGGAGQLFSVTTNPAEATGDGIAMALRAGVAVADLEFVQFHPTALHPVASPDLHLRAFAPPDGSLAHNFHPEPPSSHSVPRLLLSEALRGHGAVVRDTQGQRFLNELAPRDVVSRAMVERMAAQGVPHLWLDATGLDRFTERFPAIAGALEGQGLDPAVNWLPIAPAAHYFSGGVVTDLDGASSLPGLWACGEVACTGVHGANRLASNSLLEGLVFGRRVVDAITAGRTGPLATGVMRAVLGPDGLGGLSVTASSGDAPVGMSPELAVTSTLATHDLRSQLQEAMTTLAGVVRNAKSLAGAAGVVQEVHASPALAQDRSGWELLNLLDVASALLASAAARTETRGSHTRSDFPHTDPALRARFIHGRHFRNCAP